MKRILLFIPILSFISLTLYAQQAEKKLYQNQQTFQKVCEGMKFPEGPAWDNKGNVFVANCYGNWITRIKGEKADSFIVAPTQPFDFQKINGLTANKDGNLYACESGKGAIIRFSLDGKNCDVVCSGYNGNKFNRPNDLAFDPKGNLYFTDPKSYDTNKLDGTVYMIPKGQNKAVVAFSGLAFPNGIAFSKDAKSLFVCESAFQRIIKFPVKKDGTLGKFSVFAVLPGGDPDGIAFDKKGNLYVAHFGGGAVYVFSPKGKQIKKISAPGKKPSNLEFAGKDMKTLYLTEDETNAVYKMRVDVPGMVLFSSPK